MPSPAERDVAAFLAAEQKRKQPSAPSAVERDVAAALAAEQKQPKQPASAARAKGVLYGPPEPPAPVAVDPGGPYAYDPTVRREARSPRGMEHVGEFAQNFFGGWKRLSEDRRDEFRRLVAEQPAIGSPRLSIEPAKRKAQLDNIAAIMPEFDRWRQKQRAGFDQTLARIEWDSPPSLKSITTGSRSAETPAARARREQLTADYQSRFNWESLQTYLKQKGIVPNALQEQALKHSLAWEAYKLKDDRKIREQGLRDVLTMVGIGRIVGPAAAAVGRALPPAATTAGQVARTVGGAAATGAAENALQQAATLKQVRPEATAAELAREAVSGLGPGAVVGGILGAGAAAVGARKTAQAAQAEARRAQGIEAARLAKGRKPIAVPHNFNDVLRLESAADDPAVLAQIRAEIGDARFEAAVFHLGRPAARTGPPALARKPSPEPSPDAAPAHKPSPEPSPAPAPTVAPAAPGPAALRETGRVTVDAPGTRPPDLRWESMDGAVREAEEMLLLFEGQGGRKLWEIVRNPRPDQEEFVTLFEDQLSTLRAVTEDSLRRGEEVPDFVLARFPSLRSTAAPAPAKAVQSPEGDVTSATRAPDQPAAAGVEPEPGGTGRTGAGEPAAPAGGRAAAGPDPVPAGTGAGTPVRAPTPFRVTKKGGIKLEGRRSLTEAETSAVVQVVRAAEQVRTAGDDTLLRQAEEILDQDEFAAAIENATALQAHGVLDDVLRAHDEWRAQAQARYEQRGEAELRQQEEGGFRAGRPLVQEAASQGERYRGRDAATGERYHYIDIADRYSRAEREAIYQELAKTHRELGPRDRLYYVPGSGRHSLHDLIVDAEKLPGTAAREQLPHPTSPDPTHRQLSGPDPDPAPTPPARPAAGPEAPAPEIATPVQGPPSVRPQAAAGGGAPPPPATATARAAAQLELQQAIDELTKASGGKLYSGLGIPPEVVAAAVKVATALVKLGYHTAAELGTQLRARVAGHSENFYRQVIAEYERLHGRFPKRAPGPLRPPSTTSPRPNQPRAPLRPPDPASPPPSRAAPGPTGTREASAGGRPEGQSIQNAVTNELRESFGLPRTDAPARQRMPDWAQRALQQREDQHAGRYADEILSGTRSQLSPEENFGLAMRLDQLDQERVTLDDTLRGARRGSNTEADAARRIAEIRDEVDRLTLATRAAGSAQARAFVARKAFLKHQYGYTGVYSSVRHGLGRALTEAEDARILSLTRRNDALTKRLEAQETRAAELERDLAAARAEMALGLTSGRTSSRRRGSAPTQARLEAIQKTRADLIAQAKTKWEKSRPPTVLRSDPLLLGAAAEQASRFASLLPEAMAIARTYVEEGIVRAQDVAARVASTFRDAGIDMTDDEALALLGKQVTRQQQAQRTVSEWQQVRREAERAFVEARQAAREADQTARRTARAEDLAERRAVGQAEREARQAAREAERDARRALRETERAFRAGQVPPDRRADFERWLGTRLASDITRLGRRLAALRAGDTPAPRPRPPAPGPGDPGYELLLERERIRLEIDEEIRAARRQGEWESLPTAMKAPALVSNLVFGIPRTILASGDLQVLFLQGGQALFSDTGRWGRAWLPMLRSARQRGYNDLAAAIRVDPDYDRMRVARLEMPVLGPGRGEDTFPTDWLERVPVVGAYVALNRRMYDGAVSALRAGMMKDWIEIAEDAGRQLSPEGLRILGDAVNTFTGRGARWVPESLAKHFFALRYQMSNLELATAKPLRRALGHAMRTGEWAPARVIARKYGRLAAAQGALLAGAAAALHGSTAELELDPRSVSFGHVVLKRGDSQVRIAAASPGVMAGGFLVRALVLAGGGSRESASGRSTRGAAALQSELGRWILNRLTPGLSIPIQLGQASTQNWQSFGRSLDPGTGEGRTNLAMMLAPIGAQTIREVWTTKDLTGQEKLLLTLLSTVRPVDVLKTGQGASRLPALPGGGGK